MTTDHKHSIAKAELLMDHSGYDDRYGYVYGYRETCSCGARRITQYKTADAAEKAHQHLKVRHTARMIRRALKPMGAD